MPKQKRRNKHLPPRLRLKSGRYYYVPTIDGKQKWVSLNTSDLATALSLWADHEGKKLQVKTVLDLLTLYTQKADIKPKTLQGYLLSLRRLEPFHDAPVNQLRPHHVFAYLTRNPGASGNRDVVLLSAAFSWGRNLNWCADNPCIGVRRNKEPKRTRYITDQELEHLLSVCNPQMRLIVEMAYLTGLRKSNVLGIRLQDIQEQGLRVELVKQRETTVRFYEWSPALLDAVEAARGLRRRVSSMWLFCNNQGQRYTESGFNANWQRLKRKHGFDFTFHDIRRKALSDVEEHRAQLLAAHTDQRMTARYRVRPEVVKPLK